MARSRHRSSGARLHDGDGGGQRHALRIGAGLALGASRSPECIEGAGAKRRRSLAPRSRMGAGGRAGGAVIRAADVGDVAAQFVPESDDDTCRLPAQWRAAGQHGTERHGCGTHRRHSRTAARVAGGAVGGVLDDDAARQRRRNLHGCSRRRAGDRQDRRPVGDQPRQRELLRDDGHASASRAGTSARPTTRHRHRWH